MSLPNASPANKASGEMLWENKEDYEQLLIAIHAAHDVEVRGSPSIMCQAHTEMVVV